MGWLFLHLQTAQSIGISNEALPSIRSVRKPGDPQNPGDTVGVHGKDSDLIQLISEEDDIFYAKMDHCHPTA
jgi:hypothetical protein